MTDKLRIPRSDKVDIDVSATVRIKITDREPIERVTGPNGDEWRSQMYDLRTEGDVLRHWAQNATLHGVVDVCQLDGWADVPAETVTFQVVDFDAD